MVWIVDPGDNVTVFDPEDEDLFADVVQATRKHFLDPPAMDRCACGRWVEGDDWDEHIVRTVYDALRTEMRTG